MAANIGKMLQKDQSHSRNNVKSSAHLNHLLLTKSLSVEDSYRTTGRKRNLIKDAMFEKAFHHNSQQEGEMLKDINNNDICPSPNFKQLSLEPDLTTVKECKTKRCSTNSTQSQRTTEDDLYGFACKENHPYLNVMGINKSKSYNEELMAQALPNDVLNGHSFNTKAYLILIIYEIEDMLSPTLDTLLKLSRVYRYEIIHIDTRISTTHSKEAVETKTNQPKLSMDILVKIQFTDTQPNKKDLTALMTCLTKKYEGKLKFLTPYLQIPNEYDFQTQNGAKMQHESTEEKTDLVDDKEIWVPTHLNDLDLCNHVLVKFEPELHCSHPGFLDKEYRDRRANIVKMAFKYKFSEGGPLPRVDYSPQETQAWGLVYKKCKDMHKKHACTEYNNVFAMLEKEGIFRPDVVPQLEELSKFLQKKSGFRLRPAAGLLTARDFLASLAFRVFQATQYMRHTSAPWHTPEPDVIHEILGHIPMLADPEFAQLSQEIGLASLGATDEEIVKLATLYWFTVEFGLCKENNEIKAYGAGLMSSFGELEHALSNKPQLLPFDPEKTAIQPYQDETYQGVYFVMESFKDAKEQLLKYTTTKLKRNYEATYNPFTNSVIFLDGKDGIKYLSDRIAHDTVKLNSALSKLIVI